MLAAEIEPVGQPVYLQRDSGLECDLEDLIEIERVLRAVVDDPPLRVAETANVRVPHRL